MYGQHILIQISSKNCHVNAWWWLQWIQRCVYLQSREEHYMIQLFIDLCAIIYIIVNNNRITILFLMVKKMSLFCESLPLPCNACRHVECFLQDAFIHVKYLHQYASCVRWEMKLLFPEIKIWGPRWNRMWSEPQSTSLPTQKTKR